jgi:bifunctional UDP-N-acetylglucosamine pyrophosphorylase/glucosamine-1-phosphate N-acetyltransferase
MEKQSLVILAAGKGTRFLPLTNTVPKPMLKVAGKPVLAHQIEAALPYIDEVVIVVGHLKEVIKNYFGDSYKGVSVKYAEQQEAKGSSDALVSAKEHISHSSFFLIYGDDIYDSSFFEKTASIKYAAIGMKIENWQSYGIFQLKNERYLDKIVEKPETFVGNVANIGVFKIDSSIFEYTDKISLSVRNELEVTDVMTLFAQDHEMEIIQVEKGWLPLSYPWNLLEATEEVLKHIESKNEGTVEQGATIKGNVQIGEGTIIKSGAYIEGNFVIGKNCVIGPNCYLKDFGVIDNETYIGNAVEVTRSIIGKKSNVRHLSYVGDSIIGNEVNLAAGFIAGNLKHNGMTIKVMINNKLIDSHKTKLGTVIGDNVKTGINTSVLPGRKIWNNLWTMPGEVVDKDKIGVPMP